MVRTYVLLLLSTSELMYSEQLSDHNKNRPECMYCSRPYCRFYCIVINSPFLFSVFPKDSSKFCSSNCLFSTAMHVNQKVKKSCELGHPGGSWLKL